MTSSQIYPALTGTIDPGQMTSDATANIVGSEWYAPSSYPYNEPYMTPYPSSTVESQQWPHYARASVPDIHLGGYALPPPHPHQQQRDPFQAMKDTGRPRSSPSSLGPAADSITWTTTGLGIQYTAAGGEPTPPVTSTFPPSVFHTYPTDDNYSTSSPPEIRQPQPRRPYAPIAPNPVGVATKRKRDDDDQQDTPASTTGKRRKRTSSVVSQDLNEEDKLLVQLKEDENLPWKDIASRFSAEQGKPLMVAALQMRYKRLREKFRVWEEQDVSALRNAHEYWEKYKWEIISAKMLDFGIQERWPARHCARKWHEVENATATASLATVVPGGMPSTSISQFSSPVEGPVHFAFMPLPQ